jgi:hypothetical protein
MPIAGLFTSSKIRFLGSIHYYPFDEPNLFAGPEGYGIIRHSDYAKWQVEQSLSPNPNSSVLMRLVHMSQHVAPQFDELRHLLGPEGLGLLKNIEVQQLQLGGSANADSAKPTDDDTNRFYLVRFLPAQSANNWRQYPEVSFGTRRLLRILTSMLFDESAVMLIEQPEDGIHPGLLHKLIPLLKAYSDIDQFIIASHSPAVFNRLEPEEIRLVEIESGHSNVRALTSEEIAGAQQFISREGPLSDFLETVQDSP